MGAPKGNKFWELRSSSGRDKIFSDPEQVWNAAVEYFEWCDNNPLVRVDVVRGGDNAGAQIGAEVPRPYTIEGFCGYVHIDTKTFRNYRTNESYKDFFPIFTQIKDIIRCQKIEGAMIGNYNANLVARVEGIEERRDITSGGEKVQQNVIMLGGKEFKV